MRSPGTNVVNAVVVEYATRTACMLSLRGPSDTTTGLRDRMPIECMLISGVMLSGPEGG